MPVSKARITEQEMADAHLSVVAEIAQRETLCFSNTGDVITVRQNWDVSGGAEWETIMLTPERAIELAKKLLELATARNVETIREKPLTH